MYDSESQLSISAPLMFDRPGNHIHHMVGIERPFEATTRYGLLELTLDPALRRERYDLSIVQAEELVKLLTGQLAAMRA